MKNCNLLVPFCLLLCNGLAVVAHADSPPSTSLWTTPSTSYTPYKEETAAWTALLQTVNETLIEVWSLQQENGLPAATANQLQSARTSLEVTRHLAEQQLATDEQSTKPEDAHHAAQTAIDQLKAARMSVAQIKAVPRWATQLSDLVTVLNTASISAQALRPLFIPSMTNEQLNTLHQKNDNDLESIKTWYEQWQKDQPARDTQNVRDAENLQASQQILADATKKMKEAQENLDATRRKTQRLWKKIQPMEYL